jgi:hypothetical protein
MSNLTYTAKSESEWSRKFTTALRGAGAQVLAVVGGDRQTAGWPDRFISHPLFMGWVEIKRGYNGLDTRQQLIIETLNRNAACSAFVLMLQEYDNGTIEPFQLFWPTCKGAWQKVELTYETQNIRTFLLSLGHLQRSERNDGENCG